MKILILINAYYNTDYLKRTIMSIKQQDTIHEVKMILLENPSEKSSEIRELSLQDNIDHYLAERNIGAGPIFQLWINNHREMVKTFDIVCLTEGDVVLDKGCITEAIQIIDNLKIGVCYVGLKLHLKKYESIKERIKKWVPTPIIKKNFAIGHTGFQFIVFRRNYLFRFVNAINQKKIVGKIALGNKNFRGISDTNLHKFNRLNKIPSVQTIKNKLDHIGWEVALGLNNEYRALKLKNIANKLIRNTNSNLPEIHKLSEIKEY